MSSTIGRPPRAADIEALVKERLAEAAKTAGVKETLTIEWRGKPEHVEVIDMPVDVLYFNPNTHRIRAQRSHDPAGDRKLDEDPWSPESQEYLHYLLQAMPSNPNDRDPDFDELLNSLRDFQQNEPGLITRDGILVNGNTRRAALKEIGNRHIRVGVLPESCTWEDINAVELSLQLRKDHRRDYSYINHLLAMEEQHAQGRPLDKIAHDFRVQVKTCKRDLWVLECLRDLIDRSRDGEAQLKLLDFEEAKEKLAELYRRYVKESLVNQENAELLKEARLAAIALKFSKTDIRLIEPDFRARYLETRLPESLKPQESASAPVAIPGLGRSVKAADPKVEAAKRLTDVVLQARAVSSTRRLETTEEGKQASRVYADVRQAMEDALEPAGRDARLRKRKQAAPDRVVDACQDIEQAVTDLVLARASRSLDEETFDEAVLKLRDSLQKLAAESARSIEEPGDGVTWLLNAARQEGQ
ncbi:transcriptional regulator [Streptomyces sp. NPDC001922]|uniref:transcriptional regulator n=1 Tax=Streptomyces sp. NPDC001922 TaxID=3364624 RepID=UPI0036B0CFA2